MQIIRIAGGLGNQMFQYAFALGYSLKHNTKVKLDNSLYLSPGLNKNLTIRNYKLNLFPIRLESTNNIPFWGKQCDTRFKRKVHDIIFSNYLIKDQESGFDSSVFNSYFKKIVFDGYFQCPKYFENYRTEILKDFSFSNNANENFNAVKNQIINTNSISLHIRRGDYLNHQNAAIHGVLGLDYYLASISHFKKHFQDYVFFVFSDDISWCKDVFKGSEFKFIETQFGFSDIDEMHLMSLCHHNIIANSSFSWWGAWLNQNPNKTVIAPKYWFSDFERNKKWDIYPAGWFLI